MLSEILSYASSASMYIKSVFSQVIIHVFVCDYPWTKSYNIVCMVMLDFDGEVEFFSSPILEKVLLI